MFVFFFSVKQTKKRNIPAISTTHLQGQHKVASYTAPHKSEKHAPASGKYKTPQNTTEKPLMQDDIRTMIINGKIPSVISDTGATSTAGKGGHPFK